MDNATVIRFGGLFMPLVAVSIAWFALQPSKRQMAGVLLATAWCVPTLLLLHLLAADLGWWQFQAEGGLLMGIPADLYLGWMLLWGALPALLVARAGPVFLLLGLAMIDVLLMPLGEPVIQLGNSWLVGEFAGLAICALPAMLLARWTAEDRRLNLRVLMITIGFIAIIFVALSAFILDATGGTWRVLIERPRWVMTIYLQLLAVPVIIGLSAVQEFTTRGGGTPIPYDPPKRLVTSGVYAYLRNPMQVSGAVALTGWGLILGSPVIVLAAASSAVFSLGLAAWSENQDLKARFGEGWPSYAAGVRNWRPRWRPWHPALIGARPDRLYVAQTCVPCSELGSWFIARRPVGLQLLAAEGHPTHDLTRLTYESADGSYSATGTEALARGLEHINLGWAILGFTLRLPVIRTLVQLMADAVGGGPRVIERRAEGVADFHSQVPE